MYQNSRVTFHLKNNESILLEAMFGSEKEVVIVSYQESGIHAVRSFLYETAVNNIKTGKWKIVHVQPLVA